MDSNPLMCRVELNKETGITVTVQNDKDKITQTVEMDGTSIIIKVDGGSKEKISTVTMTTESIEVSTKTFKLDAETITCTSEKETKHESKDKMTVKSSKAMLIESADKLTEKATMDFEMAGQNVKVDAKLDAKVGATNIALDAKAELKGDGAMVKLKGKGQADFGGAMVNVKADGVCSVEGQLMNIKGQLTNVQGSLTKIG